MKTGNKFWGLVWVALDQENSLTAFLSTLPILRVGFGGLKDICGGLGAPRLALGA